MLQLKKIQKTYTLGDTRVDALRGIDLAFRDNEFVSILGPSGCGKTTLLNIIGGLDRYTSGDLIISGRSTKEYKDADWDTYRNHSIGFVFQSYNLIPHQTVLSNVELALTLSGVSKKERRQRAIRSLQQVGLGDQLHKKPSQMSGGQMQRVAIARALVNDPEILLADEPTGALDTTTSVQIMDILKEISHDKLIIMVTHNPELAEQYSSRIVRLLDGKIVGDTDPFDGTPENNRSHETRTESTHLITGNSYVGMDGTPIAAPTTDVTAGSGSTLGKPFPTAATSKKKSRKAKKADRKPSMSFFTALSLSANNLLTKKGRTFMTAFAGSIGIIGIALILALSTGVQAYIDEVQRDTLSSYPIMIQDEETDMTSLLTSMAGSGTSEEEAKVREEDAVYANSQMIDMFNALINAETTSNNLKDFKIWLDKEMAGGEDATTELRNLASSIQYRYNVTLNTYVKNTEDKYVNTNFQDIFVSAMNGTASEDSSEGSMLSGMMSSSMMGSMNTLNLWQEILPGQDGSLISDMIYEQYDLVYGQWPTAADEIVLILNSNNEVSDVAFYALGQIPQDEVTETFLSVMNEETVDVIERKLTFEEICDISFKLLLNTDYYAPSGEPNVWDYIGDDESRLDLLIKNGYDLHICGIIRPNENATSVALSAPFAYTTALTEYVIETINDSEIVKAQTAAENENFDVLTGKPFVLDSETELTNAQKAAEFTAYMKGLTDQGKNDLYQKMLGTPTEEELAATLETYMAQYQTREDMENLLVTAYGMDVETVRGYLESYTDEELQTLMAEQFTNMIKEQHAAAAAEQIAAIQNAPSEEELAGIMMQITSQLPDMQTKMGFVMMDWTENTSMSQEAIMGYLMGLAPEEFEAAVNSVAAKKAAETYKSYAGMDMDAAYAKVAAIFDSEIATQTEIKTLAQWYDLYMPSTVSGSTYADTLETLGVLDLESPNGISIYADTFESKDAIADLIKEYNNSVEEEHQIKYTDYVALLMSGITGIINAISYVLIAFVAISLVVSSIMIGIITYISVLERTKEIGILRSIGASKKDVSRVFNAETLIIGFTAGAIGIITSLLICIPANAIIYRLTDIENLRAQIPAAACAILVAISMGLTLIAGLFPAGMAARKDPVEALRSE